MKLVKLFAGLPVVICIVMSLPMLAQARSTPVTVVNDVSAPVPVKIVQGGVSGSRTEYRVTGFTAPVPGHVMATEPGGQHHSRAPGDGPSLQDAGRAMVASGYGGRVPKGWRPLDGRSADCMDPPEQATCGVPP